MKLQAECIWKRLVNIPEFISRHHRAPHRSTYFFVIRIQYFRQIIVALLIPVDGANHFNAIIVWDDQTKKRITFCPTDESSPYLLVLL